MISNYNNLTTGAQSVVTQPVDTANNLDEEFNNQFQQLLILVKKSNCKFGDFSRTEAKDIG